MPSLNYPNSEHSRFGYAFIKSGYEDVQDDLVRDFADNGLEVVHERRLVLPARVIDYIYRDSMNEHFYPAMRQHLVDNPVTSMALYRDGGDAQEVLLDLKFGRNGRESLRTKYAHPHQLVPDDEVRAWVEGNHPMQREVTRLLTQNNVFHTADTVDEALRTLQLLGREYQGYYGATSPCASRMGRLGLLFVELEANDTMGENYGEL